MTVENPSLSPRDVELIELGRMAELVNSVKSAVRDEVNALVPNIVRNVVREEVQRSMGEYFGNRPPEKILEVIATTERFHTRLSKLSENLWGTVVGSILKWTIILALVGGLLLGSGALKVNTGQISLP